MEWDSADWEVKQVETLLRVLTFFVTIAPLIFLSPASFPFNLCIFITLKAQLQQQMEHLKKSASWTCVNVIFITENESQNLQNTGYLKVPSWQVAMLAFSKDTSSDHKQKKKCVASNID